MKIVVTAILLIISINFPSYAEAPKAAKNAQQDKRGTKEMPLVIEGIPTTKSKEIADREQQEREIKAAVTAEIRDAIKGIEQESERTTFLTLGLWLVALAQAVFFVWQLCILQKSVGDSRRAALAAVRSARVAKETIGHMRDTAQKELRAYIALDDVFFPWNGDRSNMWPNSRIKIRVRNYGTTPGHQMTIWTNGLDNAPAKDFGYPYIGKEPLVNEQMLHPTQHYSRQAALGFIYSGGQAGVYVYGQIIYRDIYNDWWITRFCYLHEGGNSFFPYGEYNREEGPYKERPT